FAVEAYLHGAARVTTCHLAHWVQIRICNGAIRRPICPDQGMKNTQAKPVRDVPVNELESTVLTLASASAKVFIPGFARIEHRRPHSGYIDIRKRSAAFKGRTVG